MFATLARKDLLSCSWRLASWQGRCTRHGFTLRSTCIRRKLLSNTKSGPKNGVNFRTYNLFPSLLRAGFGGRWLVCETGPQLSFFSPFALSFGAQYLVSGAQYLVSMAAAATILCLPDRLHHQNVYLLKVSLRNHHHMRSIQLLRLQAYTHTVRAHSHEARNACFWDRKNRLADSSFAHSWSYAINTAPTTADIHTYREGPWVQGMVSCKKKSHFLDLVRSMSAQHHETYKATSSWHSVWSMIAHMAMEFKPRFLALVWHGSLQWCSVREYMEGTVRFENNVRCTIDMPTFMPPKPTRNGPGTKELFIANLAKRRNQDHPGPVLYSLPIGISDGPGFGVVGTRINIWLNQKPRTTGAVVKWQFLLKWCKNVGYSKVSAKTVRAPATRGLQSQATLVSAHRIESCEQSPTSHRRALRGACFWGLKTSISGFVAVGPHCIYIYIPPRTQMTLVLIGKRPCFGGADLQK